MRGDSPTRDAGQAMLPFLVVVSLSLLAITFWLLVPWGAATTEKAQAQTAADAAALAAADAQREDWVLGTDPGRTPFFNLSTGIEQGRGLALGRACNDAVFYAQQNGAGRAPGDVLCSRVRDDDGNTGFEVTVTLADTADPDTGRAQATATASVDMDMDACVWQPSVPPPLPTDVTFEATLRCGDYDVGYRFANTPPYPALGYADLGLRWQDLHDRLEPRLVE